jgi:polyhydroxyalkanoate synthesis regulator protein
MTSRPRQKRAPASAMQGDGARSSPRVIRKYPNRRLYDTVESRYVTLADVRRLVVERVDFVSWIARPSRTSRAASFCR